MDPHSIYVNTKIVISFIQRQKSRTSKSKNRLSSYSSSSDENKKGTQDTRQHKVVGMVTIYDASGLMPLQLELAEQYVLVCIIYIYLLNSVHWV